MTYIEYSGILTDPYLTRWQDMYTFIQGYSGMIYTVTASNTPIPATNSPKKYQNIDLFNVIPILQWKLLTLPTTLLNSIDISGDTLTAGLNFPTGVLYYHYTYNSYYNQLSVDKDISSFFASLSYGQPIIFTETRVVNGTPISVSNNTYTYLSYTHELTGSALYPLYFRDYITCEPVIGGDSFTIGLLENIADYQFSDKLYIVNLLTPTQLQISKYDIFGYDFTTILLEV